jgi:tRNA A37 methylthiotransferase MiaB
MTEKISPEMIKERNGILSDISEVNRAKAHRRQIGERLEVIAEHKKPRDTEFFGVADNFVKVKLPVSVEGGKRLIPVRVTGACDGFVEGTIVI